MPKQRKTCRVCGATYEACRSIRTGDGVFNWREVACSPECGEVYLRQVMASRNKVEPAIPRKKKRVHSDDEAILSVDMPAVKEDAQTNLTPLCESVAEAVEE